MATTGRRSVAPGEIVASEWGNDVWDQSVQCFENAADRDAQYPTPHAGAVCYLADQDRLFRYVAAGHWRPMQPWTAILTVPDIAASSSQSVAVTYPVGLFATATVVSVTPAASSLLTAGSISGAPSASGFTAFCRNTGAALLSGGRIMVQAWEA